MTVIITMAGLGSRFRNAGYNIPKYMIEAKGKTLFEWSLDSLSDYRDHVVKYIFVARKEDGSSSFIIDCCAKMGLPNIEIVELDAMTDGQATTCMRAIPLCNPDSSILIYNIDTYVEPGELKYQDIVGDGFIPCFHAPGEHWSFVRTDNTGKAIEVREKKKISDNCSLGAYYFSSASLYSDLYEEYYKDNQHLERKEKYVAPLYNLMIKKGFTVSICIVDYLKVHALGTPEELDGFLNM